MDRVLVDIFSLPAFNECQRVLKLTCKDLAEKQTIKELLQLSLPSHLPPYFQNYYTWSIIGLFSAGNQHRCIKMKKFKASSNGYRIRSYELHVIYRKNRWYFKYKNQVDNYARTSNNIRQYPRICESAYKFFCGDMADFAILVTENCQKDIYLKQKQAFRSLLYREKDVLFRYFFDLAMTDSLDNPKNLLLRKNTSFMNENGLNQYMIDIGKKI